MMQTDVKAGFIESAGSLSVTTNRTRLKAIAFTFTGIGGSLTITNGNGGSTVFSYNTPGITGSEYMLFPGEGILCTNGIYSVNGSGCTAVVFYG